MNDLLIRAGIQNAAQYQNDLARMVNSSVSGFDKIGSHAKAAGGGIDKATEAAKGAGAKIPGWVKGIGGAMAAAFSADIIVDFGRELLKTATLVDATSRKFINVFGEFSGQMEDFAESMTKPLGTSVSGVKSLLAETQDLLVPLGLARGDAAGLSKELLNLGAALTAADTRGRSAADIMLRVQKALLGEREGLIELGIKISDAELQATKAQLGLKGLSFELDQQANALVTYQLIAAKSADAVNGFANNSNSLAQQQRNLSAALEQVKEDLAVSLTPAIQEAQLWLLKVVESTVSWAKTSPDIDAMGESFGRLGATLGKIFGGSGGAGGFFFDALDRSARHITYITDAINSAADALRKAGEWAEKFWKYGGGMGARDRALAAPQLLPSLTNPMNINAPQVYAPFSMEDVKAAKGITAEQERINQLIAELAAMKKTINSEDKKTAENLRKQREEIEKSMTEFRASTQPSKAQSEGIDFDSFDPKPAGTSDAAAFLDAIDSQRAFDAMDAFSEKQKTIEEGFSKIEAVAKSLDATIANELGNGIAQMGESLGYALATGVNGVEAMQKAMLQLAAQITATATRAIGMALIETGSAMSTQANPYAGLALIIAGSAILGVGGIASGVMSGAASKVGQENTVNARASNGGGFSQMPDASSKIERTIIVRVGQRELHSIIRDERQNYLLSTGG